MATNYKKNRGRTSTLEDYFLVIPPSFKKVKSITLTQSPQQQLPCTQITNSNDRSSSKSPMRGKDSYSDRFIPIRNESASRKIWYDISEDTNSTMCCDSFSEHFQNSLKYQTLLEGQIFGNSPSVSNSTTNNLQNAKIIKADTPQAKPKLFSFKSCQKSENINSPNISGPLAYDRIPVEEFKNFRKIPEKSYKILEAPFLLDDYYLNLIDWSNGPYLSVALGSSIYLWSLEESIVDKFSDNIEESEIYTSVSWNHTGTLLASGKSEGKLNLWDASKRTILSDEMISHDNRIGCLSWNSSNLIASGSRDKSILVQDIRVNPDEGPVANFKGHKQEVCGLKWSPNDYQLASGGNDNKLTIWNLKMGCREALFEEHKAAVKAIEWSPHQSGLLLSGGGNSDKSIKIWNILALKMINNIPSGSQVCNLKFSKTSNEFVSTHGFSNNQIIIWKYSNLEKLAVLEGHSSRVLYLTLSPDGKTIVTGAGDETLRFWDVFPSTTYKKNSKLVPSGSEVR